MRIQFNKTQRDTLITIAFLLAINFVVRFYFGGHIKWYITEKLYYEELAVAYEIGGKHGLREEIKGISSRDNRQKVTDFLSATDTKVEEMKDPMDFLKPAIDKSTKKINDLMKLRSIATIVIIAILLTRVVLTVSSSIKRS